MKNILLLLVLCLPIIVISKNNDTKLVKEIRAFYDEIDHSGMKTDYLFNKGFIGLNDLEEWYNGMPVIASPRKWKYLYQSVQASLLQKQVLYDIDITKPLKESEINTANIQLLNYLGDYIRPSKIIKDKTKKQEYELLHIFSGSMDNDFFSSGDVTFSFSPQDYFTNFDTEHSELDIDFCDFQGYRKVDLLSEQEFNINYDCVGEKGIIFRLIDKKDTIIYYCKINISGLYPEEEASSSFFSTQKKDNTININKSISINVPSGLGVVYDEGDDGKLDKPIIVTEGFDIAGTMPIVTLNFLMWRISGLKDYWENRVSSLKANGYDIFYAGFWNSTCALQENATRILNLIKSINNEKEGNFEGVYIGESMGGIIGRIALKEMENEGYDHQIGLFVPYDSPFKGAYVPKGAQALVKAVADDLGIWAYEITALVDFFELIFGIDMPIIDIISQLESESASQLLVNHISEDNTHSDFQSFLSNLGYPEECRNVAVVNGSNNVTYQSAADPGDTLIYYKTWLGLNQYKFYAYYENAGKTDQLLAKYVHFDPLPFGINYNVLKRDIDQMQYCNAPGSYISADINLLGVDTKFTFVPSLSAIDISPSIYNICNFACDISNKNNVINNGLCPFDDYYSNSVNEFHTTANFNMDNLFEREVMYEEMYLQNRTINTNRDFEAENKIEIGSYVQPWGSSKIQETGDVSIQNNVNVTFTAGNSIKLRSGFKLRNGSNMKIKIDDNPNQKSSNFVMPSPPNIVGSKYATPNGIYVITNYSRSSSFLWEIRGEYFNYTTQSESFIIPHDIKAGMYTIFCTAEANNATISSSKCVIATNNLNINSNKESEIVQKGNAKIYPNPASDKFIIELKNTNLDQLSFTITNINGEVVINSNLTTNKQEVNTSYLPKGIYMIQIFDHDQLFISEKIVKI